MAAPAEDNERNRIRIIIGVTLGSFLAALDTTILSTVMPTIIGELQGLGLYSWVFSVYMIASAVSMPLWGRASDILGRRSTFLGAVAVFLAGSVLCGFAGGIVQLILFRGIQGIGAGGLAAVPFALISTVFPANERGKALGFLTSTWGVSAIIGPLLGSIIVTGLDWRWVFFVNVPGGLAALFMIARYYREHERHVRERIDWLGAALLAGAIVSLLLVTLGVGQPSGPVAAGMPFFALLFAAMLAGFIAHERREEHPILALEFFRRRVFWTGNLLGFLAGFAMFGTIAYLPLLVQNLQGGDAFRTGLVMMTMSASWSTASFLAGRAVQRTGENRLIRTGIPLMLAGFALGAAAGPAAPFVQMLATALLCGAGMGMQTPSLLLAVQHSLESRHIGIATSSQLLSRTIGGAVGVSVAGAAVSRLMGGALEGLAAGGLVQRLAAQTGVPAESPQQLLGKEAQALLSAADVAMVRAAFVQSVHAVFLIAIVVTAGSFLLTLLLPPSSLHRAVPGAHAGDLHP